MPNYAVMFKTMCKYKIYEYIGMYDTQASAEQAIERLKITHPGKYEVWVKESL